MGVLRLHDTSDGRARYSHTLAHHGADARAIARFVQRVEADVRASVAHVLVLGGGPMGLLAAIEMALLGHRVTVREVRAHPHTHVHVRVRAHPRAPTQHTPTRAPWQTRDQLNRLNILRLWPETAMCLAKTYGLEKVDSGVLWSQTKPTVSTTRLQLALLKVALIVGVQVQVHDSAADGFQLSRDARDCDALIIATGHRPALLESLRRQATSCRELSGAENDLGRQSQVWRPSTAYRPSTTYRPSTRSAGDDGAPPDGAFAVGEKANATATALVAHFEVTDRCEAAARYTKELPHTFDWTVNDAAAFDSPDPAVRKRTLERFGAAERLCCGIGPSVVVRSLASTYAVESEAYLENVLMYANKEKTKRVANGKVELPNLRGVPCSYYFIMTLKEPFVRTLVARMVQRTAASAFQSALDAPPNGSTAVTPAQGPAASPAAAAAASAAIPASAKEALAWAREQVRAEGGAISRAAFDAEVSLAATTVAGIFTQPLSAAKKLPPFSTACRLLREVPAAPGEVGRWATSTDIFDFTVSRHMKSAAEVVDSVDGTARVQVKEGNGRRWKAMEGDGRQRMEGEHSAERPLLVLHVGDALQECAWPMVEHSPALRARESSYVAARPRMDWNLVHAMFGERCVAGRFGRKGLASIAECTIPLMRQCVEDGRSWLHAEPLLW